VFGPPPRATAPREPATGRTPAPWSRLGLAAAALWCAAWFVVAAHRGGAAWHFFVLGGGVLADIDDGSRAGLHVYAEHPLLQIGPLALAAAWGLGRLANGYSLLAAQLLGAGLGVGVVLLVRRIALRAGVLGGRLAGGVPTGKLLVASACFVPVWLYAAVASVHLDDVLALTFGLSAVALVQSGRPVWAGLAVAAAVDSKPWALPLGVVLLALAPRRTRAVGVGVAAAGVAAGWLPFFLADPQTVRALHYTIVNTALSGLRVLHVTSARTPPWDRPLQALVGAALGVAALRRGRLTGLPLLVMASRLALDPGTNRYYTAGVAAGALLWDLTGSRRRWPWWSLTVLLGLHLARWVPTLDPLHGPAVVAFAVAAAASVLLGRSDQRRGRAKVHDRVPEPDRSPPPGEVSAARRGFDAPDHGPPGPAAFLEQLQQPGRAGHERDEGHVEQVHEVAGGADSKLAVIQPPSGGRTHGCPTPSVSPTTCD